MFLLKNVKYKNILDILELNIDENKITSIVGESGSGKSTLLKLLNKMISCDSGDIFFKDKSLNILDSISHRRNVVMLSQNIAIFKGNIRDNLLIGLKFSEKDSKSDYELEEVLNFVNLKKSLDENCETLSGGEKQKLALARVVLMDSEVILLDEPSSALDEDNSFFIFEKICEYVKENKKTLIMVTHSKAIANKFSDVIIQIKNGKVDNVVEVSYGDN